MSASEKGKEGLVVADKRVLPFDDRGEHIVVDQVSGGAAEETEGIE